MLDQLTEKISKTFRNLRGVGTLSEANIELALGEIRRSLLEADVAYKVVQSVVDGCKQKALGQDVLSGVNPGDQFIKIFHDELIRILGSKAADMPLHKTPLKIMMVGLQGTGKTTTSAKLALKLKNEHKKLPLLVPADTQRLAAKEQLMQLGASIGCKVFESTEPKALDVCTEAYRAVGDRAVAANVVIFDTAGRLAIDETLMAELKSIQQEIKPDLTFYVLDAMAGQDAVKTAQTFFEHLAFNGVIATKLDGDARGGALLSIRAQLHVPIYFVGQGEKMEDLDLFHPDRLAGRILGLGDVVSLVEKAQQVFDETQAAKMAQKMRKNQFTIEDFADQMRAVQKMGSFDQILGMLPGGAALKNKLPGGVPEEEMKKTFAIIGSMTVKERRNHLLIDGSRRRRIAEGCGLHVAEVNRFLKQFVEAKKMMSQLTNMGPRGMGALGKNFFTR